MSRGYFAIMLGIVMYVGNFQLCKKKTASTGKSQYDLGQSESGTIASRGSRRGIGRRGA